MPSYNYLAKRSKYANQINAYKIIMSYTLYAYCFKNSFKYKLLKGANCYSKYNCSYISYKISPFNKC